MNVQEVHTTVVVLEVVVVGVVELENAFPAENVCKCCKLWTSVAEFSGEMQKSEMIWMKLLQLKCIAMTLLETWKWNVKLEDEEK